MATEIKNTRPSINHSDAHTHVGNKAVSTKDKHVHIADEEETYEKIVGSLGDINDEGCDETDGVRFIVNDEAYIGQSETHDYTQLMKAMVVGEVVNHPRFKSPYKKR